MSSYHDGNRKLQDAIKAYLTANLTTYAAGVAKDLPLAVGGDFDNLGRDHALISISADILSTGSATPPAIGELIAVTIPGATRPSAWVCLTSAPVSHTNGKTTISATLERKDSMAAVLETAISASLDSNAEDYSLASPAAVDVGINYSAWATSISSVLNGSTPLVLNTNYSIEAGPVLRIAQAYIAANVTDPDDAITLTVRFNAGNDANLVITATA
jgi:hypothetical protein